MYVKWVMKAYELDFAKNAASAGELITLLICGPTSRNEHAYKNPGNIIRGHACRFTFCFDRCARCDTANVVTFNFCHACGTPPFAGAPVPCQPRAQPVTINGSVTINARALLEPKNEVLAVTQGRKGQQRKCAIADGFDGFIRVRTRGVRGWAEAIDADVPDQL